MFLFAKTAMTLKKQSKSFAKMMMGHYGGKKNEAQGAFQKSTFNKLKYTALDHEVRVQAMGEICAKPELYRSGKFILKAASKNFSCNLYHAGPSALTNFCRSATSLTLIPHLKIATKNKAGMKEVNTGK